MIDQRVRITKVTNSSAVGAISARGSNGSSYVSKGTSTTPSNILSLELKSVTLYTSSSFALLYFTKEDSSSYRSIFSENDECEPMVLLILLIGFPSKPPFPRPMEKVGL